MKKYPYHSRVRFSEVDENGELTLYSLFNYFQDCATFHGEDSGVGIAHNKELGIAWVIADMQLLIRRYPLFNESITVNTWADRFRGMIGHRCFSVEDEAGTEIVLANSDWVLMDMNRMEPVNVPEDQIRSYGVWPELKIEENLGKRKIRVPGEGTVHPDIIVQEEYLDTNHHMNNAQYVRMARKYMPDDLRIGRIRTEWKKQAVLGDVMTPVVLKTDSGYMVVFRDEDGEPFFVCEAGKEE